MNLHDDRVRQIRERIEAGRPVPGDAEYLLAALDHAVSGDPENYRFALLCESVGETDDDQEGPDCG